MSVSVTVSVTVQCSLVVAWRATVGLFRACVRACEQCLLLGLCVVCVFVRLCVRLRVCGCVCARVRATCVVACIVCCGLMRCVLLRCAYLRDTDALACRTQAPLAVGAACLARCVAPQYCNVNVACF